MVFWSCVPMVFSFFLLYSCVFSTIEFLHFGCLAADCSCQFGFFLSGLVKFGSVGFGLLSLLYSVFPFFRQIQSYGHSNLLPKWISMAWNLLFAEKLSAKEPRKFPTRPRNRGSILLKDFCFNLFISPAAPELSVGWRRGEEMSG